MQHVRPKRFSSADIAKAAVLLLCAAAAFLFGFELILMLLRILFGAALCAFILTPLAALYEKKLNRSIAALLAILSAVFALIALIGLLLPAVSNQFSGILDTLPGAIERIRRLAESLFERLQALFPGIRLPDISGLVPAGGLSGFAQQTINYAGSFAQGLYLFSLSFVLGYFFISDRERMLLRLELLIPSAYRRMAVRMGNGILRELRLYVRGQAIIALSVGILSCTGLFIVGVQGALLLGAIVGLFNMIPYLGPILGSIPAVLMALSASWKHALLTAGVLFLVQQIDGLVISPRVMGNVTGFSPSTVLIALFAGSQAGGIWGMLFAMPLLMSIRTIYRVFVQRHENN